MGGARITWGDGTSYQEYHCDQCGKEIEGKYIALPDSTCYCFCNTTCALHFAIDHMQTKETCDTKRKTQPNELAKKLIQNQLSQ